MLDVNSNVMDVMQILLIVCCKKKIYKFLKTFYRCRDSRVELAVASPNLNFAAEYCTDGASAA